MWRNMILMDERALGSVQQREWCQQHGSGIKKNKLAVKKDQYALSAQALADFITRNGMASLTRSIPASPETSSSSNSLIGAGVVSFQLMSIKVPL